MISITTTSATDEADWRRLWRGYLDFYATDLPEATYALSFARICDPAVTDYHGLIARDAGGRALGIVNFLYHRHGWQAADVCYLQDLYVDPETRGAGIGRALIEGVFAAADAAGKPEVYWMTEAGNTSARGLYDSIGRVTPFIKYRR